MTRSAWTDRFDAFMLGPWPLILMAVAIAAMLWVSILRNASRETAVDRCLATGGTLIVTSAGRACLPPSPAPHTR